MSTHKPGVDERREAILALGKVGASAIPRLIALFEDQTIIGPWPSCFGPTGLDPGTDFVLALAAVDALVAIGAEANAPVLAALRGREEGRYHAALAAGRLGIAEAIPLLEAMVEARETASIRVHFDQCIEYPLHEAARTALERIKARSARAD